MSFRGATLGGWHVPELKRSLEATDFLLLMLADVGALLSSLWLSNTARSGLRIILGLLLGKAEHQRAFFPWGENRRDRHGVRGTRKMLKYFPFGLLICLPKHCLPDGEDRKL